MFKVNCGNSKLGKNVMVINLPAGITCKGDAPCNKKGVCYAQKGTFNYPNVKNCYAENLRVFLESPENAENDILQQMPYMGFCRIHASGDFVNKEYLEMIIRICNKLPNVKFMAYTKKYELINQFIIDGGEIPSNLTIIFSLWDGYNCINPFSFPVSAVILKAGNIDPLPLNGFMCDGLCSKCYKCWTLQKGDCVLFDEH